MYLSRNVANRREFTTVSRNSMASRILHGRVFTVIQCETLLRLPSFFPKLTLGNVISVGWFGLSPTSRHAKELWNTFERDIMKTRE